MLVVHFYYRIHLRLGIKRTWKWVYTCAISGRNIFLIIYHRMFAGILLHFQTLILSVGPSAGGLSEISCACCIFLHRRPCTCTFIRRNTLRDLLPSVPRKKSHRFFPPPIFSIDQDGLTSNMDEEHGRRKESTLKEGVQRHQAAKS